MLRLLTPLDGLMVALAAAMAGFGALVSPKLPDSVPIHWNWLGEADGWASPSFAVWFLPALAFGLWLVLLVAPAMDRYRERLVAARNEYAAIRLAFAAFLAALQAMVIAVAFGFAVPVVSSMSALFAGLLFVFSRVMPRLPRNETAGFRLPWALSSDEAWAATHADAGRTFGQAAAVLLVVAFFPAPFVFPAMMSAILYAVISPIYTSWRRSRAALPKARPDGTIDDEI